MHFSLWTAASLPLVVALALSLNSVPASSLDIIEGVDGALPETGESGLRVLSPTILEVARVNTQPANGSVDSWDFVSDGSFVAPAPSSIAVEIDGESVTASIFGFRRRPLYAPLATYDLRIDNRVFIELDTAVPDGATVTLTTSGWGDSSSPVTYTTEAAPLRRSPALHVNQEGYQTQAPKKAMIGYYLGDAGELPIPSTSFSIRDVATGETALAGTLTARLDIGFTLTPLPYQQVWEADFSALQTPGLYQLVVPGLGTSFSFRIADDMLMHFVRTYAQGLYNQRCGCAVELPYSRHTHEACHTEEAEIPLPQSSFTKAWEFIAEITANADDDPRHTAPVLATPADQLYPILNSGTIDVSGGHHDAGDYSKYTINSAQLVHHLVFAVDAFPGVSTMDNLGLPESGDGVSDLLQEAIHEADFLAKMQDDDGGFFFLVYPKERKYEEDVLPHHGDPQIVWPKNTSSTAAAVGALADMASSPTLLQHDPDRAALYLSKAQAGWTFLLNAIATHGKDGSYQKLTHYGNVFLHDDELAWAAAAMFAATGDPVCQQKLIEWYDPASPATLHWGWWHLYEGYGCAARSYAFAARVGKRQPSEMDPTYLAKVDTEILTAGTRIRSRSQEAAYATTFDSASKRYRTAGWYFSSERAFDATVANVIANSAENQEAVIGNLNYEFGTNPVNVCYVTGAGVRRQREIVHQYSQNDDRILPPSGLPIGNLHSGFGWTPTYLTSLGPLVYPSDGQQIAPYGFYDRWADTFNPITEFVNPQQARSVASIAGWAALCPGAQEPWNPPMATLEMPSSYLTAGVPHTICINCSDLDLTDARVVWEVGDQEPVIGTCDYTFTPQSVVRQWIEAEAVLPDGRRVSASAVFGVQSASGADPLTVEDDTIALWHLDGDLEDEGPNGFNLDFTGSPEFMDLASGWMANPSGMAVRFYELGDSLTVTIPDSYLSPGATCTPLTLEAQICPLNYRAYGADNAPFLLLEQGYGSELGFTQNKWQLPANPHGIVGVSGGSPFNAQSWSDEVEVGGWQSLKITRDEEGHFEVWLAGELVGSIDGIPSGLTRPEDWTFTVGNFNGYVDEIRISGLPNNGSGGSGSGDGDSGGDSGSGDGGNGFGEGDPTISPFTTAYVSDSDTIALYHFDGDFLDAGPHRFHLTPSGTPQRVDSQFADGTAAGQFARFSAFSDTLTVSIPDSYVAPGNEEYDLTLEAWIFPRDYKAWANGTAQILSLHQNWNSSHSIQQDKWLQPSRPFIKAGSQTILSNNDWDTHLKPNCWQHIRLAQTSTGLAKLWIDDVLIVSVPAATSASRTDAWVFSIGSIDADFDEVRISKTLRLPPPSDNYVADEHTIGLYHFDGNFEDSSGNGNHLVAAGNAQLVGDNLGWMGTPSGQAIRFSNVGDSLSFAFPDSEISPGAACTPLTLEARLYPRQYRAWSVGNYELVSLRQHWDSSFGLRQNKWGSGPYVDTGNGWLVTPSTWLSNVAYDTWHHIKMTRDENGVHQYWVNGELVSTITANPNYGRTNDWILTLGNLDADIDELRISNIVRE